MTLFFADVSNWQQGMSLAGMPAVIAKATEGTGFVDPFYAGYRQQAADMGVPFVGYHYLHHGSIEAQAALAFSVVGAGVPLMLDVEVVQGDADPTLADVTQFVAAYRARGGRATLIYLPQWFWSGRWGSPDLRPLAALGLALISSNYTTYSDAGPGWKPYGGVAPAIWQYTSSATINGRANVDMNAYHGSTAELAALFNGSTVEDDDMTLKDEVPAAQRDVGTVLSDLYGQEMHGGSNFVKGDKSYRTVQLDRIDANVAALADAVAALTEAVANMSTGGVDVAAIAKAVNDDAAARLAE